MDLKFLGYGSAFNPKLGITNAYFEQGKDLYLLDCGGSAFEQLMSLLDLKQYDTIYVLLTHLHADHVGSLGTLISYEYCVWKKQVVVVYPDETIIDLLSLLGIQTNFYQYQSELPSNCTIKATPILVRHAEEMNCYGYLLEDQTEKIYYSGDSADVVDVVREQFLKGEIQRIYHDTSSVESNSHCYSKKLEQAFPREFRKNIYCMHLDCQCEKMLKEKGFSVVKPE